MAIDDNTLYGLTGAQVKELPGKIRSLGGVKKITADNYNYPTTNPDGVALWLLDDGVYFRENGVKCYFNTGGQTTDLNGSLIIISDTGTATLITEFGKDIRSGTDNIAYGARQYFTLKNGGKVDEAGLVSTKQVQDNLTSTSANIPLSAKQGKVLKDLIDSIAIRGAGAPTTSTVGQVGTLYEDTTNGDLYICTDAANPYVWEEVGGSSVNVVQSPGTSRTDVMSQYAATKLVYPDYSSTVLKAIKITGSTSSSAHSEEVTIGYGVSANAGRAAVGVGYQANNNGNRSVAIGNYARATADGSIAIGEGAYASTRGEMNIGTSTSASYGTSYGYNNTAYRLLTGLYDPQSAHDAATKGYVDTAVAGAGASVFTTNEWNALWA